MNRVVCLDSLGYVDSPRTDAYPTAQLRFRLDKGAVLPTKAHRGDAGYDLAALGDWDFTSDQTVLVDTGVHVAIPDGYVGLVFERSSLHRRGFSLQNKVGVIDGSYRGSIGLPLRWHQTEANRAGVIEDGQRIAQLVVVPCLDLEPVAVSMLPGTERGDGGFGSTGA